MSSLDEKVVEKLSIYGEVSLNSPLLISNGEKGSTDIYVIKDINGNPYIPATAFTGVLRHYFYENVVDNADSQQIDFFWGSKKDVEDGYQSSIYVSDLYLKGEAKISIRDGIKINDMGVTEDKKKFDYENVEPGAVFNMAMEVIVRKCFDEKIFLKILSFIIKAMENCKISIGSMTTKGFGRFYLKNISCYKYDFTNSRHVIAWLSKEKGENITDKLRLMETYTEKGKDFSIDFRTKIKGSLIIRSYSSKPEDPDAVNITSAGKNIIPGTSIKGAIRYRAEKIIKTLGFNDDLLNELFGWADEETSGNKKKFKSKFIVEETVIDDDAVVKEIQSRIKINRFTGGTIKTALFDEMPIWQVNGSDKYINIRMQIKNYDPWEAGLLLLILKDLWNEDLPIGGDKSIGRGILHGISAKITFDGKIIEFYDKNNELSLSDDDIKCLENLVGYFLREGENPHEVSK